MALKKYIETASSILAKYLGNLVRAIPILIENNGLK